MAKPSRSTNKKINDLQDDTFEAGPALTSNQGVALADDQNSLKAGPRGPSLLEDFHLREKIMHFDHERIPERVVHARGAAAHGVFEAYGSLADLTVASLFAEAGKQTPVFVRFSTVAGSRGSADTARDVRGFAVKFYTDTGVWDLVGNNIPVFFIQDAIKFPDLIHAVKPEPHNEIPQAQSAHDTFWDFASLTPESAHMLMWVMSDRGIPRSYAMMEGFGIHTFRFVNAAGESAFVKFHWKPLKGVHSLVWDEAQRLAGKDPDFNRRDLFDAIERGDFPEWELGIQVIPEADEGKFDFDLLDATKLVPEEEVPVRIVGKLTLNRNPDNYFAETEQVAFCVGHIVPGIDFTNDPLLQGRLFSYLDTQLRRVGPNFAELPINRPVNPVHNNQRDGEGRQTVNKGRVAYFPNSLGGGLPAPRPEAQDAFRSYPAPVDGIKLRERAASFADHFSQASLFWHSVADWEKAHIAAAFAFELNMCTDAGVRERVLNEILVHIDADLATRVAEATGIRLAKPKGEGLTPSAPTPAAKPAKAPRTRTSAALSMDRPAKDIRGRKVGVLAAPGIDDAALKAALAQLEAEEALAEIIAATAGTLSGASGETIAVDRAAPNAPSLIYDAVLVPSGGSVGSLTKSGLSLHFIREAFLHGKPIAFIGDGAQVLAAADLPGIGPAGDPAQGVLVLESVHGLDTLVAAMRQHRFTNRDVAAIAA